MQFKSSTIQKDYQLLQRLGIALLMLTLTRIVFLISNYNLFQHIYFTDFIAGIWIDAITIGLFFLPFYILSLLPVPFYRNKWYQVGLQVLFHLTNVVLIALNLIDVEYFKFTSKRSTADLFSMMEVGNDFKDMLPSFLEDFWWLVLIFILLIVLSIWLYKQTKIKDNHIVKFNFIHHFFHFIIGVFILLIISRGGFSYRPADALIASNFTVSQNTPLVLNTPFSVLKTIDKPVLKEKHFFPIGSPKIYTPIHHGTKQHELRKNLNVVVVLLESFGDEWIGKNNHKPYTPFFDSLLDQSLYFDNAFANGKKSIEAVPAVFAGIPSLLDNPYITSPYGTNKIKSLVQLLHTEGYSSAFYHGATNGSMNFDVFTSHLGFQHYYGRNEYNNEADCGPVWGVLDEYFLPWTARNITKNLKQPFIAGLFTLSSHHPYYVPKKYRSKLPKSDNPMAQAVAYSDMSLRKFFATAKKQPWYKNTIFIFTADHTPAPYNAKYSQRTELHQIPIAIFDPQHQIKPRTDHRIFSQIDIMPTILDLVGYPKDFYALGNSYFSKRKPFAINYIDHSYALFQGDYMLQFMKGKPIGFYNYKEDIFMHKDSSAEYPVIEKSMNDLLKGYIQRYNHDLIHNSTSLKKQSK